MTSTADTSIGERRQMLRRQLLAQRQLIAQQLEAVPGINSGFPRSMTMRFLIQQPDLVARLFPGLVASGKRARYLRLIIMTLTLLRIIQSASINR